jgi:hypothetical protein
MLPRSSPTCYSRMPIPSLFACGWRLMSSQRSEGFGHRWHVRPTQTSTEALSMMVNVSHEEQARYMYLYIQICFYYFLLCIYIFIIIMIISIIIIIVIVIIIVIIIICYICVCVCTSAVVYCLPQKKGKTDHLFWFHGWIFQLTIPMTGSKMIESCYRNSNHCYDDLYLMVLGYGQWLSSGVPHSSVRVPKNESLQTIRSVAFEVYPIRSWYPFCAELHGDTHGAMAASWMGFSHKWTGIIWLWLTVCHGKSPCLRTVNHLFLSISMGHLYHGYVTNNQRVILITII